VVGFEAEGSFTPTWWLLEGLKLTGTFGWSDSEFTDFVVSKVVQAGQKNPPKAPRTADFVFSGYPLIASPEWSTSAIISWEFPIFEYGFITPAYDFNYRSKLYFDPSYQQALAQDPYWLHNARIAYTSPNEAFEVSFWVENIFKKEYKVDAFDVTRVDGVIAESWGEPRMYGASLSLNW
jgi:outer membrane receptor protein involved in Fe transport